MEDLRIRPESVYRTTMFIVWSIISVLGGSLLLTLLWVVRDDVEGMIVISILSLIFAVVMMLVAVWIPFYVTSLEYSIGERSVRMKGGVLWKRQVTVPFGKVTNVDTSQGPLQRIFGIGMVHVQTAGAGGAEGGRAELRIAGVREFDRIKDMVLALMEQGTASGTLDVSSFQIDGAQTADRALLNGILQELTAIRELLSHSRT